MIRYINCIRKRADISAGEFREYWLSAEYGELLERVAGFYQAERHFRSLTLQVEMGERLISERGLAEPFDGTVEFYWTSASRLASLYETEDAKKLAEQLGKYQSEFIDLSRSTAFFTELGD
ncbi:MAG TPA: hypothetical protein ENK05_14865 [Gammaproteobacteria bacterium]|nr:hypothetical protein [Gammaproteobacteria bacterium]